MLYAAGYDAEKQVLDVIFNSGGLYRYFDAPQAVYDGLLKTDSPGRFMWENVLRIFPNMRLDRPRGTRRAMSGQHRQLGTRAAKAA
jgi:hypothetical protein